MLAINTRGGAKAYHWAVSVQHECHAAGGRGGQLQGGLSPVSPKGAQRSNGQRPSVMCMALDQWAHYKDMGWTSAGRASPLATLSSVP